MKTAYYLLAASTLLLTFSCISSTGPDDPETVPPTVPVVTTADFTDLTTSSVKVAERSRKMAVLKLLHAVSCMVTRPILLLRLHLLPMREQEQVFSNQSFQN